MGPFTQFQTTQSGNGKIIYSIKKRRKSPIKRPMDINYHENRNEHTKKCNRYVFNE